MANSRSRLIRPGTKIVRRWLRKENAALIRSIGNPSSIHEAAARLKGNAQEFYRSRPMFEDLYGLALPVGALETEARIAKQKAGKPRDRWMEFVRQWLQTDGGKLIKAVDGFSVEMVIRLVSAMLDVAAEEGWSVDRMATRIMSDLNTVAEYRARRIARTEIGRAYETGSFEAARETGLTLKKVWLTANDGQGERHATADYEGLNEQTRDMDEPFDVGGYAAMYPMDIALPPGESCNCRCSTEWVPQ